MPLNEETKEEGDAWFYNGLIPTLLPGIKAPLHTHTHERSQCPKTKSENSIFSRFPLNNQTL